MYQDKGVIIDKEKKIYKIYVSFLGIKFGDWQPLLNFNFVATTKRKGAQKLNAPRTFSASSTITFPIFCVYLCINKKLKVLVIKTKNKQEAFKRAEAISEYLKIDWINYIKE
ncbi:MAG: hypothetical protein K0B10_02320 [Vicingaceae bacterium]|nr:hypothetical protein [Vicingaceae bacterium]